MKTERKLFLEDFGAVAGCDSPETKEKNRAAFEDAIAAAEEQDATLYWPDQHVYL